MNVEPDLSLETETLIASDDEELVGQVINERYKVESVIAHGGWGSVVKAWHLSLERYVALKLLHPHLAWDAKKVARFKQEAQAASMLSHQNILTVRDYGYWSGRPYLVMDFLGGHTLADEIKANPGGLSTERFFDVFQQVVSGVVAAHRADIVHRDITPANIFIIDEGPDKGSIKVLDFGLAKLVSPDGESVASLTQTGASLGTPAYMSPEQCKSEKIDVRTDIYALGCCMYEALAGRKVFEHDTVFGFMSSHVDKLPDPLPKQKSISPAVESVVLRCLEKEPEDRPQNAVQLLDALTSLRAGKKPHFPERRTKATKHRWLKKAILLTSVVVFLTAVVLSGLYFRSVLFVPEWQKEYKLSGTEYQNNNYQGAIFHQVKAVELASRERLSPIQMGELYYNLGVLYSNTKNWTAAREAFHSAGIEFEKIHQYEYLASMHGYLMMIEFESGSNDKAIAAAEKRVELVRKHARDKRSLSNALQQLSEAYARVGDLPKTKRAFDEALGIDQSLKDPGRVCERYVRFGDLLDKLHRHNAAIEQYTQALKIMDDPVTREKIVKAQAEAKKHPDPK